MDNTIREKFEEWWRDYNAEMGVELSDVFAFERDEDGDYTLISTQDAWAGWQAAHELSEKEDCCTDPHAGRGEPVAWQLIDYPSVIETDKEGYHDRDEWIPLYTQPPAPCSTPPHNPKETTDD